jgi:hypothetical protein
LHLSDIASDNGIGSWEIFLTFEGFFAWAASFSMCIAMRPGVRCADARVDRRQPGALKAQPLCLEVQHHVMATQRAYGAAHARYGDAHEGQSAHGDRVASH